MANTSSICILAAQPFADLVLEKRMAVFANRVPDVQLRLNPAKILKTSPTLHLGYEPQSLTHMHNRNLGIVTSQTYQNTHSNDLMVLPDLVAGLDRNLVVHRPSCMPVRQPLWLSVDLESIHVPGVRQALDWVDSCIQSLMWLNNPQVT